MGMCLTWLFELCNEEEEYKVKNVFNLKLVKALSTWLSVNEFVNFSNQMNYII